MGLLCLYVHKINSAINYVTIIAPSQSCLLFIPICGHSQSAKFSFVLVTFHFFMPKASLMLLLFFPSMLRQDKCIEIGHLDCTFVLLKLPTYYTAGKL